MRRQVSNLIIIILYISILSCSPDLEDKVKIYEQAHNNHDIEKVMSLYTSDIRFEIVGTWIKTGREQVRGVAEWDAATNSNMIISNIEVHEDTVTFNLKEGNEWFRLIGIEYMYYEPCKIVFFDGLIKELKAEVTHESIKAFQEVWPSVYQWLYEEKNEELSELMSEGEFLYNSENAKKWLSLLRELREKTNEE